MFAGTGVVGEVIAEAEPRIYCLKGFWILPNPIPPEYQVVYFSLL